VCDRGCVRRVPGVHAPGCFFTQAIINQHTPIYRGYANLPPPLIPYFLPLETIDFLQEGWR
jgi:hypothetical protein